MSISFSKWPTPKTTAGVRVEVVVLRDDEGDYFEWMVAVNTTRGQVRRTLKDRYDVNKFGGPTIQAYASALEGLAQLVVDELVPT